MKAARIVIPVVGMALLMLGHAIASPSQLAPANAGGALTYFIAEGTKASGYRSSDRQLAEWALQAWERSAGGAIRLAAAPEPLALIRVYWASADGGLYGEMRPLRVGERLGAAVFIIPDAGALDGDTAKQASADPLLRDTIVYLTCLHELGHALGLEHTAAYADIMYFFGYGGDIPHYFDRYRTRLKSRADIAGASGLSEADVNRLKALYPQKQ